MPTIPPHRAAPALTSLTPQDFEAFHRAGERGFQEDTPAELREIERGLIDPARFFGFTVGDRWISTFGSFARRLTVPGGAAIDVAAVTAVTVHGAYRRRGLLRQMMGEELRRATARGEVAAVLYASESGIYGRFGYGSATPGVSLRGPTRGADLRPEISATLDRAGGSVDEVDRDEYLALAAPLHDRLRTQRPGSLDRPTPWWQTKLADPPARREGATALRYVASFAADGRIDGHATYRVRAEYEAGNPNGEVRIGELEADGPAGYARLWRYLLSLDLVRRFTVDRAPVDHPMHHMVTDPRAIVGTMADGLYVRLVDVESALRARRYAAPIDLVVAVRDEALPHNAGRYRINGGGSAGVDVRRSEADPDLTLDVRELGAMYLGGVSAGALHAAGLVAQHSAGAVTAASAAFAWPVAPFCSDMF